MRRFTPILACVVLAGCSDLALSEQAAPDKTTEPVFYQTLLGEWIGPEGTFARVRGQPDGTYRIEMQSDLDTRGTYLGKDGGAGIVFTRNGEELVLRAATGAQTGMKWLADKTDCVMVKPGEGYCRR